MRVSPVENKLIPHFPVSVSGKLASLLSPHSPLGLQLAQVGGRLLALPMAAWVLLFLDYHPLLPWSLLS